jgi:hypothetical protein
MYTVNRVLFVLIYASGMFWMKDFQYYFHFNIKSSFSCSYILLKHFLKNFPGCVTSQVIPSVTCLNDCDTSKFCGHIQIIASIKGNHNSSRIYIVAELFKALLGNSLVNNFP